MRRGRCLRLSRDGQGSHRYVGRQLETVSLRPQGPQIRSTFFTSQDTAKYFRFSPVLAESGSTLSFHLPMGSIWRIKLRRGIAMFGCWRTSELTSTMITTVAAKRVERNNSLSAEHCNTRSGDACTCRNIQFDFYLVMGGVPEPF